MTGIPKNVMRAQFWFSADVYVEWPSWDGHPGYDVWDATRVRQGAQRIEAVSRFGDACESARALVRMHAQDEGESR